MFNGTGTIREKRDDDGEISATAFFYLEVHPTTLFKKVILKMNFGFLLNSPQNLTQRY